MLQIINIDNDFKKVIGLDFSLNGFYVDTMGKKVNYPMYYMNSLKKLAKEQRRLSHKVKLSHNYVKQKTKNAKLHEKISSQRNDFLNKLSRKLVNRNDFLLNKNNRGRNSLDSLVILRAIARTT